jgi:hypothetical protein
MVVPGRLIPGPEPFKKRYGILTAASGPMDLSTPHERGGGVRYTPVTCGVAHPYPIACYDGLVEPPPEGKPRDLDDAEVDVPSFMVIASIECGSIGHTTAEDEARVSRRMANGEQGAVERALWTGLDDNGNSLDIPSLDSESVAVTAPEPDILASVISALEDYAYRIQGYGNVAYIHAPVSVAAHAADGLVISDGPLLRTPYGSIWIFGGGYPGTGPGGDPAPDGGAYLHVTGQVNVWRSSGMFIYPPAQTMNRVTNQKLLIAEREYAAGFDCFAGRAAFDPLGGS